MRQPTKLIAITLAILLVVVRVLVHIYFSGVYTDGDQTITWLSAVDKANGDWYSLYFYGQFYNISVVAILAAVLIKCGLAVQYAVPIVANVVGFMPFVFGAWYLLRIKQQTGALLLLCLGMVLPAQYHFVTAMARGFAGGIAVFSIGLLLTSSKSVIGKALGYSAIIISYFINPNVLIIAFPLGLLWLIQQRKQHKRNVWNTLVPVCLAAIIAIIAHALLNSANNPLYEVHRLWRLELGFDYLVNSLQSLDARFLYLFPFLPKIGSLLLVSLVVLVIVLFFKQKKMHGIVLGATVLFVVATLSLNKTLDGTYSTFFPFSRMYLALPYVLVLGLAFVLHAVPTKRVLFSVVAVGIVGCIYQCIDIPVKAKASVRGNSGVVQVIRIDKLCMECEKLTEIQHTYNADVTVFHYKTDEYIYGCKALQPEIQTLYPEYDRRYWTFVKHADTVYDTVLFMDWSLRLPEVMQSYEGNFSAIDSIHYPAFILTDNTQSIIDLYTINSLPLRPYKK